MPDPLTFVGAVVAAAKAVPAITSLLGDGAAGVFEGSGGPTRKVPYVRLTEIGNVRMGRNTGPAYFVEARAQVDVFAADSDQSERVLAAWEAAFKPGTELPMGDGRTLMYVAVENDHLLPDDEQAAAGARQSRRAAEMAGLICRA